MINGKQLDWAKFSIKCDNAIASEDSTKLEELIDVIENLIVSENCDNKLASAHYFLGNLCTSLSCIYQESITGWRSGKFPECKVSAINAYRRAEYLEITSKSPFKHEIRTNLANGISKQARTVEALYMWQCNFDIPGDSPFVATYRKGQDLRWLSHFINDPDHAAYYQIEAYKLLNTVSQNISDDDHPDINDFINNDPEIKEFLRHGSENFSDLLDWAEIKPEKSYSGAEMQYRRWCLTRRLFANDLNDLTSEWIASRDILQFPNYIVKVGDGPFMSSAFSALKRDYCFARFMAYEGINDIHPDYENRHLFLADTLDGVRFEGSIEKVKTSFRISFSVLDSISALLNQYFKCGAKQKVFSSCWIKNNLKDYENPFIDALYWLSCDLTDTSSIPSDKWKAPDPDSAEIRSLRNAIEHGWLRVVESEPELGIWEGQNDYAHIVSSENLKRLTIKTLRLVRAAMMYLCYAVKYEEDRKRRETDKDKIQGQGVVPIWLP